MKQLRETYGLDFWDDTLVRVIKTFFQALLGSVTAAAGATVVGLGSIAWPLALSIAALSALFALFTAIAGAQAKGAQPRRALEVDQAPAAPRADLSA